MCENLSSMSEAARSAYDNHPYTKTKVCPCRLDENAVKETIDIYGKAADAKSFVEELERRRVKGRQIWFDEGQNTIFIAKVFACEFGGGNAGNDSLIGKACHCSCYNHLTEFLPKHCCQCSAEYFRPMFEPIFGESIELYPFKTVLSGDDECVIAVKIQGGQKHG